MKKIQFWILTYFAGTIAIIPVSFAIFLGMSFGNGSNGGPGFFSYFFGWPVLLVLGTTGSDFFQHLFSISGLILLPILTFASARLAGAIEGPAKKILLKIYCVLFVGLNILHVLRVVSGALSRDPILPPAFWVPTILGVAFSIYTFVYSIRLMFRQPPIATPNKRRVLAWVIGVMVILVALEAFFINLGIKQTDTMVKKCSAILSKADLQAALPGEYYPLAITSSKYYDCIFDTPLPKVDLLKGPIVHVKVRECLPRTARSSRPYCNALWDLKNEVHYIDNETKLDIIGQWKQIGDFASIKITDEGERGQALGWSDAEFVIEFGTSYVEGDISFYTGSDIEVFLRGLAERAAAAY